MPNKKVKVSELNPTDNLTGLWALGSKFVDGTLTSVKVSFTLIQTAYENALEAIKKAIAATEAAVTATKDMRQLEATVEGNEEERESNHSIWKSLIQAWSNNEGVRQENEANRIKNNEKWIENEADRIKNNLIWTEREDFRIVEEELRKKNETTRENNEETQKKQEVRREEDTTEAILNTNAAADRLNDLSEHRDEIREGYWWRWNEITKEWYNTGEIAKGNVMFSTFELDPVTGMLTMFTDPEYTGASFELNENGILTVII